MGRPSGQCLFVRVFVPSPSVGTGGFRAGAARTRPQNRGQLRLQDSQQRTPCGQTQAWRRGPGFLMAGGAGRRRERPSRGGGVQGSTVTHPQPLQWSWGPASGSSLGLFFRYKGECPIIGPRQSAEAGGCTALVLSRGARESPSGLPGGGRHGSELGRARVGEAAAPHRQGGGSAALSLLPGGRGRAGAMGG